MTIFLLQQKLKQLGFYKGELDSDFGKKSLAAYLAYHESIGTKFPKAFLHALRDFDLKEIPGDGNNPRVLEFHQHTTLKATEDSVAWCSAAMCCWQEEAGGVSTRSASARSWLNWGTILDKPVPGCVAVMRRGSSKWEGHVAFWLDGGQGTNILYGGNQSDMCCVRQFPEVNFLGYRI